MAGGQWHRYDLAMAAGLWLLGATVILLALLIGAGAWWYLA